MATRTRAMTTRFMVFSLRLPSFLGEEGGGGHGDNARRNDWILRATFDDNMERSPRQQPADRSGKIPILPSLPLFQHLLKQLEISPALKFERILLLGKSPT